MAQTQADVKEVIADYEALWNGDFSKLEVVAESADVYDPAAPDGEVHGREPFEAFLRETREAFPDFTLQTQEMLVEDETVMVEWTVAGTLETSSMAHRRVAGRWRLEGWQKPS
ncbi:nuclear transport factor 2 family protein [Natronomonas salina]|uniref:nuclear transport factor 2 family protein n=1 Tax=Natronomonas salina TaxID=1710540 RepID=UPI001BA46AB6